MKSSQVKKITYILELDEEEATWLAAKVQNPASGYNEHNEPIQDKKMRHKFWEALRPPMVAQK